MLSGSTASGFSSILMAAAILSAGPLPLYAAQAAEQAQSVSPDRVADLSATASWEDFVTLEVGEDELVLTNVSDRPIVAWSVRQVTRISEGNEGWGGLRKDSFGYAQEPGGYDDLLLPGESVTLERPPDPWIRPDLKGPEYLVYYDVGALVFENAEWVGVPEVVDRIFDYRLKVARDAVTAIEVLDSTTPALERLPEPYQNTLRRFASRADGVRAVLEEARIDYESAVANLRPEDLAKLPEL
ncbi:MAG TPA: hypothetical protein VLF66_16740 [Thermoanaerobaculia bacterium]|nr:hypothetical protein [Thermoanaerobaculia bacterium]